MVRSLFESFKSLNLIFQRFSFLTGQPKIGDTILYNFIPFQTSDCVVFMIISMAQYLTTLSTRRIVRRCPA